MVAKLLRIVTLLLRLLLLSATSFLSLNELLSNVSSKSGLGVNESLVELVILTVSA
jgi:hypothetical protein